MFLLERSNINVRHAIAFKLKNSDSIKDYEKTSLFFGGGRVGGASNVLDSACPKSLKLKNNILKSKNVQKHGN